jgi:hypothetical protein
MAKKKNVVKKAKTWCSVDLFVIVIFGWLLAAYTLFTSNDLKNQESMILEAKVFLEDRLYIRAIHQYQAALREYDTKNNLIYETELLGIYQEAEMMEEYFGLIDDRIEAGTAQKDEYLALARMYIEEQRPATAISVLKQGISIFGDGDLAELKESICYAYSPVTTTFSDVRIPSNDWCIPAFDGKKWGYIGANGRTVLDFIYEEATPFSGKYGIVKLDGVYTLIDKNGYWNAIDKNELDQVTSIVGTRIVGVKDGQYRIYTNTFVRLGEETYENVYLNDNGLITVKKNGRWAILDGDLNMVTGYQFTDVAVNSRGQVFHDDYAVVADERGYYLINPKGEPYFEERFADAKGMEEGLYAVADDSGRWGFADENGQMVVACQYEDVYSFSNHLAAVKYAGQWGYINKYNIMVIEPQFTRACPFIEGSALVMDERGMYRILTLKYYDLF